MDDSSNLFFQQLLFCEDNADSRSNPPSDTPTSRPTSSLDSNSDSSVIHSIVFNENNKDNLNDHKSNDYVGVKLLARGANAAVYKALKKSDTEHNFVALKVYQKLPPMNIKGLAEFELIRKLDHPNVLEVFGITEFDQQLSLVMEWCSKGDLWGLIQSGEVIYSEATRLFSQLMCAVAYLHENGIVHRDLKPENCLISESGSLKIADFSEAVLIDSFIPKRTVIGDAPYLAPEEFEEDEDRIDVAASDIWSCGIIFLTMMYGRVPWPRATISSKVYEQYLKSRIGHKRTVSSDATASPLMKPNKTSLSDYSPYLSPEFSFASGSKASPIRIYSLEPPTTPLSIQGSSSYFSTSVSSYSSFTSNGQQDSPRRKFDMIDKLPEAPKRVLVKMLQIDKSARISAAEVTKDPWLKESVQMCS
ncbi:hypothetical protein HK098_008375 [Nowakowskiella sp. JEL0407]|nr:hypothetical protein HK098_008375 [Nowakowskiella sp. JEL0407]